MSKTQNALLEVGVSLAMALLIKSFTDPRDGKTYKIIFSIFVIMATTLTNIAFAQSADAETKKEQAIYDRYEKMTQASTSNYFKCLGKYKTLSEQIESGQTKCQQEYQARLQEYQTQTTKISSDYTKCLGASGYTKCQQEYQARLMQTQATSGQTKCIEEYKAQTAQGVKTAANDYAKCIGAAQAIIAEANKATMSDYTKCLEASGQTKCQQEYQTRLQEYQAQTTKISSNYAKCLEKYKAPSEQVESGKTKCQQEYQIQQAKIDKEFDENGKLLKSVENVDGKQFSSKIKYGSMTDTRDEITYKTVKIGEQTWMAENLNHNVNGSKCYDNQESNCAKYGRLYDWETAMKACPSGWHLPSSEEWDALVDFAGGDKDAGEILKASSGWTNNGNGTDAFGFSALPGGDGDSRGYFRSVGSFGFWWSATEYNASYAYYRGMRHDNANVSRRYDVKPDLFSVRCVQD